MRATCLLYYNTLVLHSGLASGPVPGIPRSVHHQVIDKYTDWSLFFQTLKEILPPDHQFVSQDDVSTFIKAVQQAQTVAYRPRYDLQTKDGGTTAAVKHSESAIMHFDDSKDAQ